MRYRLTPEVAGGVGLRSDSTTTSAQLRAGAALPFASRQLVSIYGTHEVARGGWPPADTAVSAVNAQLLLAAAFGGSLMVGGQARGVTQLPKGMGGTPLQYAPGLRFGGVGEVRTPIGSPMRLEVRGELENQWTEAPISIRENGAVTGVTGHVYVYPIPRTQALVIDTGAQARRLMLAPTAAGDARPEAEQLLAWGGADWVMWQSAASHSADRSSTRTSSGPPRSRSRSRSRCGTTSSSGAWIPSSSSASRSLPRSSITMGTMLLRNAWFGGRLGFELRGGAGYDTARSNNLFQGGRRSMPWREARAA
jgi:hypothetical protein